ncbi:MAG: hypothetical protein KatS3mg015_3132 [Fimbriimonadales bacterium]|nr:MAG: hypothetical protein KatS3mg015_3132 [Fimbriimonadales bacterium]
MSVSFLVALDTYTRQARLKPALLVLMPSILALIAYYPEAITSWMVLPGLLGTCGMTMFLSQVSRSLGKKKESLLFDTWGGKPTTLLLRHRNASNKAQLERWHRHLRKLFPDVHLPTAEEESQDPAKADAIYELCVDALREKVRDRERFPLLFEENCSYGFRRNLWAMKPIGLFLAIISTIAVATLLVYSIHMGRTPSFLAIAVFLVNAAFCVWWVTIIKPTWVEEQANIYARQLLASCEQLQTP